MPYILHIDDNFHYMDEAYRRTHGEYATLEDALNAAKAIVDAFLISAHTPGMTPEDLYQSYKGRLPKPAKSKGFLWITHFAPTAIFGGMTDGSRRSR